MTNDIFSSSMALPRGNILQKGLLDMPKVTITNEARDKEKLARRMDKFDSVITEYMRSSRSTTDELALKLGISKSSLWRYRHQIDCFDAAPFGVITKALHLANCPNDILRYICGM